ncbi:MAG: heavy metal translocating P-type ATPase, partial [Lachnospiraceae bacterium]|nr:heavy metal translocating P-type ATPase [Lachnospiraceae bacterium]
MKFEIKHSIKGRLRVHIVQGHSMTYEEADMLLYYLQNEKYVTKAKVYDRTGDVAVSYVGDREHIVELLRRFHYEDAETPEELFDNSGRALNHQFQERLIGRILFHYARKWFLPAPAAALYTGACSLKYIAKGLKSLWHRKMEVSVLDATAIGVSILRGDYLTASSVMFLLGIGETLEDWTHKRSVDDLARTLSLNVSKVWLKAKDGDVLVPVNQIKPGDEVVIHMGNVIPFDGTVTEGEAMVNQASLTGESVPVRRTVGNTVYAGTVVEEGELMLRVVETSGSSRFEKIVTM